MTLLYFVRHAAAEDARPGLSDAQRDLTSDGIRKFRRAARGIVRLVAPAPPQFILTSPLLRARHTAELLVQAFADAQQTIALRDFPALATTAPLSKLLQEIAKKDALVVGHEPSLSNWIGELCFGKPGQLELKKGALAAVERTTSAHGRLLYLLPPAILRDL
jgi:phosphohistidine phosphatase